MEKVTDLAPIILFVYNRPWHTEQTLQALQKNIYASDSTLYVYADGPKEASTKEDQEKIAETRKAVKSQQWCKQVNLIEREKNFGLAANVVDGVTSIVNKHGKIIVLEDDLVTSPYFLKYCNDGLNTYKDSPNVYAINGYQFPIKTDKVDTFLSPLAQSSWGWATWADKWKIYEKNPTHKQLIQNHPAIRERFNLADFNYTRILDNPKSWAIWWYCSIFMKNGLGLFPTKSLVVNIGWDGSGENCKVEKLNEVLYSNEIPVVKKDVIDLEFYGLVLDYNTSEVNLTGNNSNLFKRIVNKVRRSTGITK